MYLQVFLVHIQTLPPEDIKVLIGDNLAAHLSPDVLKLCQENNIRFCFLPENSTHLMQPLDVGVFGPMKRFWREILREWKEECDRKGLQFATLPKTVSTGTVRYKGNFFLMSIFEPITSLCFIPLCVKVR